MNFPVSAIASFEEYVPANPFLPFPTNWYTLVVFSPNTPGSEDLKIFELGAGQNLSWTVQLEAPLIGTVPRSAGDVYATISIQRDLDNPRNLNLISVTKGKHIIYEHLGVGR